LPGLKFRDFSATARSSTTAAWSQAWPSVSATITTRVIITSIERPWRAAAACAPSTNGRVPASVSPKIA
jgi:hypothetical protein